MSRKKVALPFGCVLITHQQSCKRKNRVTCNTALTWVLYNLLKICWNTSTVEYNTIQYYAIIRVNLNNFLLSRQCIVWVLGLIQNRYSHKCCQWAGFFGALCNEWLPELAAFFQCRTLVWLRVSVYDTVMWKLRHATGREVFYVYQKLGPNGLTAELGIVTGLALKV